MKPTRLTSLILACLLLAGLAFAQTVSEQLVRIQTDPASGRVQAFFEKVVTVEGVSYRQPWQEVSWEIGSQEPVEITLANGSTATTTRGAIFAAVQAIAAQEKAAAASP
jgi:hypothetical protein